MKTTEDEETGNMDNCIRVMDPDELVTARMEAIRLAAPATLEAIDRELARRGLSTNGQPAPAAQVAA